MLSRFLEPLRRLATAPRFVRGARAAALLLCGLEATYLVGANAFLSSKQLQSIISAEDGTLRLSYDSLWTVIPGRYTVSGLRIAGRSHTTQWQLDIDHASFTCNVLQLFRRRFDVWRVDGDGVGFRLRLPPPVAEKDAPANVGQPAIPWFDATDWPPPSDEITPPDERWTVAIAGVSVATRELWVDRFRHEGPGRATGRFTLTPSGGFEVGPANLSIPGGRIALASQTVASDLSVEVACRIGFFPLPVRDNAREILRVSSTRIIGSAQIADLSFLNPSLSGVRLADGSGRAKFDLDILQGLLTEHTKARFDTDHLSVEVRDEAASVGFSGPAFATYRGGLHQGTLGVGSPLLSFRRLDQQPGDPEITGPAPTVRDLDVTLLTTRPQLGEAMSLSGFRARLGEASVPDVRFLGFPAADRAKMTFLRGAAQASGALSFEDGVVQRGEARFAAQGLTLRIGDEGDTFHAEVTARADAVAGEKPGTIGLSDARVDLNDVAMHMGGRDFSHWWVNVATHEASIGSGSHGSTVGSMELHAKNAYPALLFALEGKGMTGLLREHLSTDPVDAHLGLAAKGDRFDLHVPSANAGPIGTSGHLRLEHGGGTCGAFLFTQRGEQRSDTPLSLGIAFRGGETSFMPTASTSWLDERIKGLCPPRTAKR
jgi:hypothetical protein